MFSLSYFTRAVTCTCDQLWALFCTCHCTCLQILRVKNSFWAFLCLSLKLSRSIYPPNSKFFLRKSMVAGAFFFHIYHHHVITTLLKDNFGLYLMLDLVSFAEPHSCYNLETGSICIGGCGERVIQETESLNCRCLEPRSWHLCKGPVIWTIHL